LPTRSRRPPPETSADCTRAPGELRSFGRKRGRRLSARQQSLLDDVLPRLVLDRTDPAPRSLPALFAAPVREVWLEIGFGGAEHLLWQASHNSEVGLIGCEVFEDGVVKALTGVAEHALANVRLSTDDARDLLRWLPPASLGRVFVLFPDPWPKKRHVKRRLVTRAFLDLLAHVMTPRAELRIATDIGDYARTILLAARRHPALAWQAEGPRDWRERPADWPQTRYEAKARGEGRRSYFFRFFKQVEP
jgi:tRNA (guanine-N7-)-methyltransferase